MDLYRFYNADDQLLYLGISLSAAQRAAQHRDEKSWWPEVVRMDVEHLPVDRRGALEVERGAIQRERPIHNVIWNESPPLQRSYSERLEWRCSICRSPIDDEDGYVELPSIEMVRHRGEMARWKETHPPGPWGLITASALREYPNEPHWWIIHRQCDPDTEGGGYWIGVERIRTLVQLLQWTQHLMGKTWFAETDWGDAIIGKAISMLPRVLGSTRHGIESHKPQHMAEAT